MADLKISQLTAISVLTPATDVLPVVDVGGVTKKITTNQILGSGGTATLASATITGNLTVRTNKLLVTATGVGVGAAPVNPFDVTSTSGTLSVFKRTGSNGAFIGIEDGSGAGLAYLGVTNGTFSIQTPGSGYSDKLSVDTSGNVSISTGNLVMATSGKGIDFSATANSSGTMTSELLNDYEEGTWTGTITGSTTNPTVPVTQVGRYTKIGRQVNVQIWFFNVDTTGASGEVLIGGLPFANASGNTAVPGSVSSQTLVNFTGTLISQIGTGATGFELYSINSGAGATNATHNPGAARRLALSSTYQTA